MKFKQEKEVQIVLQICTSFMLMNLKFFTSIEQPGPSFYILLNLYPIIDNMPLRVKTFDFVEDDEAGISQSHLL